MKKTSLAAAKIFSAFVILLTESCDEICGARQKTDAV